MKRTYFITLLAVLIIAGAGYLAFNSTGVIKYISVKGTADSLSQKIDSVNSVNTSLVNGIDSLKKKIPAKIERLAREEYGMARRNEEVVKVKVVGD